MFRATTYTQLNRQLAVILVSPELVKALEELNFFGVGDVAQIIAATADGEIDEQEDPKESIHLTNKTRRQYVELLNIEIIRGATKTANGYTYTQLPIEPSFFYTLKTLVDLKQAIEDPTATYIAYYD